MAAWGLVSACTGLVQDFNGLVACRFVLGVAEAVFFPGALFYLSTFYSRRHLAQRIGILYAGSQVGNAVGGLFAIAILSLNGVSGMF